MVFLGDSITQQRIHTRYVMDFFALRYPDMQVTFRNAGWVSDTAPGGLKRLERDVLSLKPTVVSICYGMNDGGVGVFKKANYIRFMDGMSGLVSALKKAGVQVVLLTPGCVDPDQPNWNPHERMAVFNPNLAKLAEGVELLAKREHLPVSNIHRLMLDVQTRAKADDPKFTMIPDGVHPNWLGQALMAYGLIKALGGDEQPSGLRIDASTSRAVTDRCRVTGLRVAQDSVSFTRTDEALPTWFDPQVEAIYKYCPIPDELNRYAFKVTGLANGAWKLAVEGMEVGEFSSQDLANGISLADRPGPWKKLAVEVNKLCTDQEAAYFERWRKVDLAPAGESTEQVRKTRLQELDTQIANDESARAKAVSQRTWKWSLTRVK